MHNKVVNWIADVSMGGIAKKARAGIHYINLIILEGKADISIYIIMHNKVINWIADVSMGGIVSKTSTSTNLNEIPNG